MTELPILVDAMLLFGWVLSQRTFEIGSSPHRIRVRWTSHSLDWPVDLHVYLHAVIDAKFTCMLLRHVVDAASTHSEVLIQMAY
jgi:hypothetical protein